MKVYSISQLNCYKFCPQQYKFKYIDKIKGEQTEAMARGSLLHEVLETHFKMPHIEPYQIGVVYEEKYKKTIGKTPEHLDYAKQGRRLIEENLPRLNKIKPVGIEEKTYYNIDDFQVVCIADLLTEDTVIDHKTSGKILTEVSQGYKDQLTIYSLAFDKQKGAVLNWSIPDNHLSVLKYTPTEEDKESVKNEFRWLNDKVINNDYSCDPSHKCEWCDCKHLCKKYEKYSKVMKQLLG